MNDLQIKHKDRSWLQKYSAISEILIETGSHEGEGIESALVWGFKTVISVEIQGKYHFHCQERFKDQVGLGSVILLLGDSVENLPVMINIADSFRATFWLDAHMAPGERNCPVLDELEQIRRFSQRKDHNILIDDYYDFGTPAHENITIEEVKDKILEINSAYEFSREDTGTVGAVLAARIY